MAESKFYITAGLPAIDSADSPPSGDNQFFITAGLVANDYAAAASNKAGKLVNSVSLKSLVGNGGLA